MRYPIAAALLTLLASCGPQRAETPSSDPSNAPSSTIELAPGATWPEPAAEAATATLEAEIVHVGLVAECGAELPPGTLSGSVEVSYANEVGGAGALEVVQSELAFASAVEGWVFPVELATKKSVVAGAHAKKRVAHESAGTSRGAGMLCSLCGQSGRLSMTWRAPDGAQQSEVRDFTLECRTPEG